MKITPEQCQVVAQTIPIVLVVIVAERANVSRQMGGWLAGLVIWMAIAEAFAFVGVSDGLHGYLAAMASLAAGAATVMLAGFAMHATFPHRDK